MDKQISGRTQTLALIGSPVGHSGSPAMYNYCFKKLGFDCVYVAFDVPLEKLFDTMAGIKAPNFPGINITMPCKEQSSNTWTKSTLQQSLWEPAIQLSTRTGAG